MTEDHESGSLAAVAEKRLRSRIDRPLPAERRLLPARYLRIPDFLSSEEHQELLDYAVVHQEAFGESGVLAAFGGKKTDYGFRRSRMLCGPEFEKRWDLFAGKLQGIGQICGASWRCPGLRPAKSSGKPPHMGTAASLHPTETIPTPKPPNGAFPACITFTRLLMVFRGRTETLRQLGYPPGI